MKQALIGIGALGFIAFAVWVIVAPAGAALPDPETAEVAEIQKALASERFAAMDVDARKQYMDQLRTLPGERRREIFRMEGASDEDRKKAREVQRDTQGEAMRKEVDDFFTLSPEEQTAFLDAKIGEMDARRGEWQKRREEREKQAKAEGKTPETRSKSTTDDKKDGSKRERKRPSPDQIQKRGEERLSEHSPEERAKSAEYRRRLMERWREAHPDATTPFRGGFGGGPGRGRG